MEYQNEHQRQMAILEAALPYVEPVSRHAIQILLQTDTLIHLASQHVPDTSYSLEAAEADGQGETQNRTQQMLHSIRQYLTPRESDMVQTIQNFLSAHNLFQNYREFIRSQEDGAEAELSAASTGGMVNPLQMLFQLINGLGALGSSFGGLSSGEEQSNQNKLLRDFLLSQLSAEQKATFEQIQNIMYNN